MDKMNELREVLQAARAKFEEDSPEQECGYQLEDIAAATPGAAEIILKDMKQAGMGLAECAKKIEEYARTHRGKQHAVAVSGRKAEKIIREFYGLPEAGTPQPVQAGGIHLDLADFL